MSKYLLVTYQTYPEISEPFRTSIVTFENEYPTEEEITDLICKLDERRGELRYTKKIVSMQRLMS